MLKNVMEPQCFKWWQFPGIEGEYFSVRHAKGKYHLLSMREPANMETPSPEDYEVKFVDNPECSYESHQLAILEKHFGVKLYDIFNG